MRELKQSVAKVTDLTSLSPKSSPTDFCRIAPEETRVTMRPDPDETGVFCTAEEPMTF